MAAIKFKDVALGYDGCNILNGISFSINQGDYLCIVGENGSGKTTLMKGILGIIKPSAGTIESENTKIGYLPQQSDSKKDFPVSAEEIILSGCLVKHKLNPFYTKADRILVGDVAKRLEITDILKKCYRELSGGQKQRVLLARALCAAENLLVLDEPVAGLDPVITNEMYKIIDDLNTKENTTVIMVSHDIKAALKYASHIMHIGIGNHFFGTKDEYLASEYCKSFTGGEFNG